MVKIRDIFLCTSLPVVPFQIQFANQEGVDGGGLRRELMSIAAEKIFCPEFVSVTRNVSLCNWLWRRSFISGFFLLCAQGLFCLDGKRSLHPRFGSLEKEDALKEFFLSGVLIGMAIYWGVLVPIPFSKAFLKCVVGEPLFLEDMESVDEDFFNSIKWMLQADSEEFELAFDSLAFVTQEDEVS